MKRIVSIFMVVVLICSLSSVYADDLSSRSALTDFWDKLKFAWGCDDATSLICAACGENISFDQLQSPLCPYCGDELLTKNGALKYGGFGGGSSRGGGAGRDGTPALSSDGKRVVYMTPSLNTSFSPTDGMFSIVGDTVYFSYAGGSSAFNSFYLMTFRSNGVSYNSGFDWSFTAPVDGTYVPYIDFHLLSGQLSYFSGATSVYSFTNGIQPACTYEHSLSFVGGFPAGFSAAFNLYHSAGSCSQPKSIGRTSLYPVYNSDQKVYYSAKGYFRAFAVCDPDKDYSVANDSNVDTASKVVNIDNSTSITYNTAYNYGDTYIVYDSNNNPSVLVRDQSGQVIAASYFDEEANCYMVTVHNGFSFGSSSGSDSGSSSDDKDDDDDEPGGLWGWIFKKIVAAIEGIAKTIGDLIGAVLLGILELIQSVLDNLTEALSLIDGFSSTIGSFFSFLPPEFQSILVAGFSCFMLIAIFKFIRG